MQVFFCMGCHRFRDATEAMDHDMVQFVPVPKYKTKEDILPFYGQEVAARRVTTPILLCPDCTPVRST